MFELHAFKSLLAGHPICVCGSCCVWAVRSEKDHIREEENRWNETEEGNNYVELVFEHGPVGTHPEVTSAIC